MSTLGRILCAIDLEKGSERAFDRALNLAIIGMPSCSSFMPPRQRCHSRGARVSGLST